MACELDFEFDPSTLPPPNAVIAELLAEAGVPVFPCDQNKRPLTKSWPKDATCDLTKVAHIWARDLDMLVGVHLAPLGLIVFDADGPEGIAAFEKLCAERGVSLAGVPIVETPSGGRHYIFKQRPGEELGNSRGSLPPKSVCNIDVRGAGGYIIAPGSWRIGGDCPDGLYELVGGGDPRDILAAPQLPDALAEILLAKPDNDNKPGPAPERVPSLPTPQDDDFYRYRAWALAALAGEAEKVAATCKGGRNDRLNIAAFAAGTFVGSGHLDEGEVRSALLAAAEASGLAKDDGKASVRKTIASGLSGGKAKPATFDKLNAERAAEAAQYAINRENAAALDEAMAARGEDTSSAAGPTWDAPDFSLLRSSRREPPAFDPKWLGPEMALWCKAQARATCAPVDYVGVPFLAFAGGLLANRRRPVAGARWSEPPLLWAALVGDPSSGKSPASGAVMALANSVEADHKRRFAAQMVEYRAKKLDFDARFATFKSALKTNAKSEVADIPVPEPKDLIEPIKPFRGRAIARETTVEGVVKILRGNPAGVIVHRDELSGFLANFGRYSQGGGGGDRAFWLEAYGGQPLTVDRASYDEPVDIPRLAVGLVGGIQPEKAAELLKGADDGFVSRFLWSWPEPTRGLTISRAPLDASQTQRVVNRLASLSMRLVDNENEPHLVPLEEAAVQRLDALRAWGERESADASPLMRGAFGKAPGHVLRLACALEFIWWASSPDADPFNEPHEIGEAAVATACDMVADYFLPMAARVFGDAAIPAEETNAAALARYLADEGKPTFNASTGRYALSGALRVEKAMSMACEELVEAGLLRPIAPPKVRGRPPKQYAVNPALFKR